MRKQYSWLLASIANGINHQEGEANADHSQSEWDIPDCCRT